MDILYVVIIVCNVILTAFNIRNIRNSARALQEIKRLDEQHPRQMRHVLAYFDIADVVTHPERMN